MERGILSLYFRPCQLTNFRYVTLHKWVSFCVKCVLCFVLKFHDSVFVSLTDEAAPNSFWTEFINKNLREENGLINFEDVFNRKNWNGLCVSSEAAKQNNHMLQTLQLTLVSPNSVSSAVGSRSVVRWGERHGRVYSQTRPAPGSLANYCVFL